MGMKARTSGRDRSHVGAQRAPEPTGQSGADLGVDSGADPGATRTRPGPGAATVDDYIARHGDWRGEAIARLRQVVRDVAPDATEAIKWAQPVFESNGPFCYVKAFGNRVNIGFWRGAMLDDPDGLLTGAGNRMKHIKLASADIPADAVRALVAQAVALNARHGNPTRRG